MRPKIIKVCGMRDAENILSVEQLVPDWMGFICWQGSARNVEGVPAYMPATCRRVGVFVNPTAELVMERISSLGISIVQLHGQETPGFCRAIKARAEAEGHPVKIIKAFSVKPDKPFPATCAYESCCDSFLFDTYTAKAGGSGRSFDWHRLQDYRGHTPFLLSGGIGAEHLEALRQMEHPLCVGVDLNSRFEVSPALKDVPRLAAFIQELREI